MAGFDILGFNKGIKLVGRMRYFRKRMFELLALGLGLQLIAVVMPLFTQWIIDSVIPASDRDLLFIILASFTGSIVLKLALDIITSWGGIIMAVQMNLQWSTKIMWHIMGLPMKWFGSHDIGDILSRCSSVSSVQAVMTSGAINLVINAVFLVMSLVVMVSYSMGLAAIAVGATVLYLLVRVVSFSKLRELNQKQLILDGDTQTTLIENFQCIESIKTACIENLRMKKWVDRYINSTENNIVLKKYGILFGGVHSLVEGGETILILGMGASLVIDGNLTLGMLMAFVAYKTEFTSRAQQVVDGVANFLMLRVHIDRLAGIVESQREDITTEQTLSDTEAAGVEVERIQLENVYYRYNDEGPWVIENLCMEIIAGEHVVITGVTGCGKSTLAKIILGLIEPTRGEVKVNGIPLKKFGLANWRSKFSAVIQSDQLFSTTVAENISLSTSPDLIKLKQAAKIAQIDSEIEGFENGYETQLQSMAANVSGGQKQRIMIARAIYRNTPVLILDEATSHLDEATERKLNVSLTENPKTIISIAHRAETINSGSRIYCMKSA